MPKRVIDFDAMWGSDKLAACAEWAQAEYAWLYGLADASGCFELTNLRVIWGRVAAIRKNLTIERLEQIVDEFQDKGLLFVWEHEGKRYGHWTGSDVPGRLPPPSWRMRLERFAPPLPKQRLAEYMSRYARGRAALAGVGFREEGRLTTQGELSPRADNENLKCEISHLKQNPGPGSGREEVRAGTGLKDGLEAAQAQDLDWNLNRNGERGKSSADSREARPRTQDANQQQRISKTDSYRFKSNSTAWDSISAKELAVQRELRVGQGPVCGPANVRPEVLERIRLREAAQARSKSP
jgi:hypothetical protein